MTMETTRPGSGYSARSPPQSPLVEDKFEKAFDNLLRAPASRVKRKTLSVAISQSSSDESLGTEKSKAEATELPQYAEDWPIEPETLSPVPNWFFIFLDVGLAAMPLLLIGRG
jgi:hypothetical protein